MPVEGHIIDYVTKDSVKFLYFEDIDNNVGAVYDEVDVRGRSEGHMFYSHTGPDTYSLSIRLAASVDQYDKGDAKQLWSDYLFIKSFQFPDYGGDSMGPVLPPRKAIIQIGKWFKKVGAIVQPRGSFLSPYDEDGYPMVIDVQFTLRVINTTPLDLYQIRIGQ